MLIREAIAQGSADLKYAGINTPNLDASLLLAHVLKTDRTHLIAEGAKKLSVKECAAFCEFIERRASGECSAYITGRKEFRGLEFNVDKSVLVPRPDTETLVEAALEIISSKLNTAAQRYSGTKNKNNNIKVLDLCTGSGAIAISLKNEIPQPEIYATDISLEALETAKANASRLVPKDQIHFYHGDLYNALPLCAAVPPRELFSLIISNPPYIPSGEIETLSAEVQNEPRIALDGGETGLEIIRRIIDGAPDFLAHDGTLLLEADPSQMSKIKKMFIQKCFEDIIIYKDLSGLERVIGGSYKI
ncbi:MAG: peptide chain release factor N(5)-glutamine methyltransferase [Treponema sp.]|nr:peptide chain release factor N(5)-glutamine methyltransferase [Treponema sp.]